MRKLKFRAFCKRSQEMFPVLEMIFDEASIRTDGNEYSVYSMNNFEIMQYTGLKDKNSVEIYEGDIIKEHFGAISAVKFKDGCFIVDILDDEPRTLKSLIMADFGNKVEVLGNIYDNKELLNDNSN